MNPWPGSLSHLKSSDPTLASVIESVGEFEYAPSSDGPHFDAILRSIVYQQISGKAAASILRKVEALYGGRRPTPQEVLETPDESLRGAGISPQKLRYLKDLAARSASPDSRIESLHELTDEDVIQELTAIKGVGTWTAQMVLMFGLARPNVLPDLDLGIRKAIQRHYKLPDLPSPAQVQQIGAPWRPYCTVACLYLWRSLDT